MSRHETTCSKPTGPHFRRAASFALLFFLTTIIGGCAVVPLEEANSLKSYDGLTSVDGRVRKAKFRAQQADLVSAKTVYIEPTTVSSAAGQAVNKDSDRALVANAISRALCAGVSDRLEVVDKREGADLIVHATVTRIVPTNPTVAGVSTVASLGSSFVLPVSTPRIPLGLGGLAVEAEAIDKDGRQLGAMVWSKGANSLFTNARVSQIGDAYSLASDFGGDFSKMLVTGKTPFKGLPRLPSSQKLRSNLGGKFKFEACERFGRAPGIKGFAGAQLGIPPSWTDKAR